MKSYHSDICVICGKEPAITDDHIPPKGIFPKPRPSDLITIRACQSCNGGTSELDEIFKVAIGIAGGHGIEGEAMFKEPVTRTLKHNERLTKEIQNSTRDIWVKTPDGLLLQKSAYLIDSVAHDTIIEKIIRGLHFIHTGIILGDKATVKVFWHNELSIEIVNMSQMWPTVSVGEGKFVYKFFTEPQAPFGSVWVLEFFKSSWSSGVVLPVENRI